MSNYQSAEAFCLMWYACPCGHRERFWNSRDGVTPFMTLCPSCNQPEMKHVDWKRDVRAPHHKPAIGQRLWVTMTRERATVAAKLRIAQFVRAGKLTVDEGAARLDSLVESIFGNGLQPDLVVFGYADAIEEAASAGGPV